MDACTSNKKYCLLYSQIQICSVIFPKLSTFKLDSDFLFLKHFVMTLIALLSVDIHFLSLKRSNLF